MVDNYRRGSTPNPDVICNQKIKFGLFLNKAIAQGADYIATGHYALKVGNQIYIAKDKNKDQTYFLWTLKPRQIEKILFPLGKYLKNDVRKMAKRAGLLTHDKKDSQGICFLGSISLAKFLKNYIPSRKGAVVSIRGEIIGQHDGAHQFTIGQRHGLNLKEKNLILGIKGQKRTEAHYVVKKDIEKNIITVAEESCSEHLYKKKLYLSNLNFLESSNLKSLRQITVLATIRYRASAVKVLLSGNKMKASLVFDKAQKSIASGQSAVFYSQDNQLLGGGIII